jgi:hypothetical protein
VTPEGDLRLVAGGDPHGENRRQVAVTSVAAYQEVGLAADLLVEDGPVLLQE